MKKFITIFFLTLLSFLYLTLPVLAQETTKSQFESWIPIINTLITVLVPIILVPLLAKWISTKKKKSQAELLIIIAEDIFKSVKFNNPNWAYNTLVETAITTFKQQLDKINPEVLERVMKSMAEDYKPITAPIP